MKLDKLALIAAIVAGVLWLLMAFFGVIGTLVASPLAGLLVGFFFCVGVYILARLIIGRLGKDDPFDRIER